MIDRGALERAVAGAEPGELFGVAGELQALAISRLAPPPPKPSAPEVNISVAEAARRLAVSRDWIYKNARALPFVARIGGRVVCSAPHVEKFRTARLGGGNGSR